MIVLCVFRLVFDWLRMVLGVCGNVCDVIGLGV